MTEEMQKRRDELAERPTPAEAKPTQHPPRFWLDVGGDEDGFPLVYRTPEYNYLVPYVPEAALSRARAEGRLEAYRHANAYTDMAYAGLIAAEKEAEANALSEEREARVREKIIAELREDAYRTTFGDYDGSMDKHWLYAVADHLEKKAQAPEKEER